MNVKGLSIQDIMSMDWNDLNKLSTKEMKQVTSRLISAANKRVRRLQKMELGTSSLAYQTVEERGRNFSVRGKDVNQVRNEFKNVRNFLNMKTSTAKGWKEYQSKVRQNVKKTTGIDISKWDIETQRKMWKVFRKFSEMNKGTFQKGDSDRIQKMLVEMIDNTETMSEDELLKSIDQKYTDLYEDEQSKNKNPDVDDTNDDEPEFIEIDI